MSMLEGWDVLRLAMSEPQEQKRQQREFRNRKQRRDEGDADPARQRRKPDREANDDAGDGAEDPAGSNPHDRKRQMVPERAADRELPEPPPDRRWRRQEQRIDPSATARQLPQRHHDA